MQYHIENERSTNYGCFRCTLCTQYFNRKDNLVRHSLHIHKVRLEPADILPSFCCASCRMEFRTSGDLSQHAETHQSSVDSDSQSDSGESLAENYEE